LTNISEANAALACSATNRTAPVIAAGGAALAASSLPDKKDYMAYSAPPLTINNMAANDAIISDMEQGFTLGTYSGCNGSSANGLNGFSDSAIPSSSYMYSLAGTLASGIKSLITGSVPLQGIFASTEACVSRYGVQDVYGNAAEWVRDSMTCTPAGVLPTPPSSSFTCAPGATAMGYVFGTVTGSGVPGLPATYGFDSVTGPFYDKNSIAIGPDVLDDFMTEWNFVDRLFSAGNFSFPLGLPINTDIATKVTYPSLALTPTLLDIGSGITSFQLHGDGMMVNAGNLFYSGGTASQTGTIITGVGTSWTAAMNGLTLVFADGTSAGVITFVSATSLTVPVAAAIPVVAQKYMLVAAGTASQTLTTITGVGTAWTAAMNGQNFVFADGTSVGTITFVSATSLTVTTSQTVAAQGYSLTSPSFFAVAGVNTGFFAVGGSYLSGLRSGRFTMELIPASASVRKDVGFRCVVPVSTYTTDPLHGYIY
jgi:hypothetical protein